jgi:hypothetical protein
MAEEAKTISGFTPEAARIIGRFVRDRLRELKPPTNTIKGRWVSAGTCFAKVTGNTVTSSTALHDWHEVRFNPTTFEWEDTPDGFSGTSSPQDNYLVNIADPTAAITNDTIVEITKCENPDTGFSFWVGGSSGSLPIGQYPGMTWLMVANNQAAWAYPFAVQTV